jgi:branched-chain amino acid transport system ATP-binding protein
MSQALLEVSGLTVGYGGRQPVLHDVSLTLHEGGMLGLVGMNGAGKTTLMRTLSGSLKPYAGDVQFLGTSTAGVTTPDLARQGVVLLPEGHRVLRTLTVEENLQIATMQLRRGRVRDRLDAARPLIYELFPILGERRGQLAGLLSGGEQQMLSIARAIVQEPRLLLLDEPSLGLAPLIVDRIYEALAKLRASGMSMLVVEQNSERVARHCDQLIVLRDGRIGARGAPAELRGTALTEAYFG